MSNDFEVNTNEYLQNCDSNDVIKIKSETWSDIKKIKDTIFNSFNSYGIPTLSEQINRSFNIRDSNIWFKQGAICEILRAGSKGWQKGKIKINVTLEFIPDELEETSPLDDVRQELEQNNS